MFLPKEHPSPCTLETPRRLAASPHTSVVQCRLFSFQAEVAESRLASVLADAEDGALLHVQHQLPVRGLQPLPALVLQATCGSASPATLSSPHTLRAEGASWSPGLTSVGFSPYPERGRSGAAPSLLPEGKGHPCPVYLRASDGVHSGPWHSTVRTAGASKWLTGRDGMGWGAWVGQWVAGGCYWLDRPHSAPGGASVSHIPHLELLTPALFSCQWGLWSQGLTSPGLCLPWSHSGP